MRSEKILQPKPTQNSSVFEIDSDVLKQVV